MAASTTSSTANPNIKKTMANLLYLSNRSEAEVRAERRIFFQKSFFTFVRLDYSHNRQKQSS